MSYDISYEGDDHAELAAFLTALGQRGSRPWGVQVTHSLTDMGDPTEHTTDYALLDVVGDVVHLRPWPADFDREPVDVGTDVHVSVGRISGIKIY